MADAWDQESAAPAATAAATATAEPDYSAPPAMTIGAGNAAAPGWVPQGLAYKTPQGGVQTFHQGTPWDVEEAHNNYVQAQQSGQNVMPALLAHEANGGFQVKPPSVKLSDVDPAQPNTTWDNDPAALGDATAQWKQANPGKVLPEALQGTISDRLEAARNAQILQLRSENPQYDKLSDDDMLKAHLDAGEQEAKSAIAGWVRQKMSESGGVDPGEANALKVAESDPSMLQQAMLATQLPDMYQQAVNRDTRRKLTGGPLPGDTPDSLAYDAAIRDAFKQRTAQQMSDQWGGNGAFAMHMANTLSLGLFSPAVSALEKHILAGPDDQDVPTMNDVMAASQKDHPYLSILGTATGMFGPSPAGKVISKLFSPIGDAATNAAAKALGVDAASFAPRAVGQMAQGAVTMPAVSSALSLMQGDPKGAIDAINPGKDLIPNALAGMGMHGGIVGAQETLGRLTGYAQYLQLSKEGQNFVSPLRQAGASDATITSITRGMRFMDQWNSGSTFDEAAKATGVSKDDLVNMARWKAFRASAGLDDPNPAARPVSAGNADAEIRGLSYDPTQPPDAPIADKLAKAAGAANTVPAKAEAPVPGMAPPAITPPVGMTREQVRDAIKAPITSPQPSPTSYPPVLPGADAVGHWYGHTFNDQPGSLMVQAMASSSPGAYELRQVPVGDIHPNQLQANEIDPQKVARYASQSGATQPPMIAVPGGGDQLMVADGGHRLAAAIARGDQTVPAYVPAHLAGKYPPPPVLSGHEPVSGGTAVPATAASGPGSIPAAGGASGPAAVSDALQGAWSPASGAMGSGRQAGMANNPALPGAAPAGGGPIGNELGSRQQPGAGPVRQPGAKGNEPLSRAGGGNGQPQPVAGAGTGAGRPPWQNPAGLGFPRPDASGQPPAIPRQNRGPVSPGGQQPSAPGSAGATGAESAIDEKTGLPQHIVNDLLRTIPDRGSIHVKPVDQKVVTRQRVLADQLQNLVRSIHANPSTTELADPESLREELAAAYGKFLQFHGPLHLASNARAFAEDPLSPALLSMENWDSARQKATPGAILQKQPESHPAFTGGGFGGESAAQMAPRGAAGAASMPTPTPSNPNATLPPSAGSGTPAGTPLKPLPMPEMLKLATELMGGKVPLVRNIRGGALGMFTGKNGQTLIRIRPDQFKDPHEAAAVLAHEIGHLEDFIPTGTLSRGNLLGRILKVKNFLKQSAPGIGASNSAIRKELIALSEWWSPYDKDNAPPKYIGYRNSPRELYAEAFSVLLNAPGEVESRAPLFWSGFIHNLNAHADFKAAWLNLQDKLNGTSDELMAARRADVREDYATGEDARRAREAEARATTGSLEMAVKQTLLDTGVPVQKRISKWLKVDPDNASAIAARNALDEMTHRNNPQALLQMNLNEKVFDPLAAEGVSHADFGEYLQMKRIAAGDRGELANPRGHTPDTAQQMLDSLEKQLGPAKWQALESQYAPAFHAQAFDLAKQAADVGYYSQKQFNETIVPNKDNYAKFSVIEHLKDYVTPRMMNQIGTFKPVENPAVSTTLYMHSLSRAIDLQRTKLALEKAMLEHEPENWVSVKAPIIGTAGSGENAHPLYGDPPPAPKGKGYVTVMRDGRPDHMLTDKYIANIFDSPDLASLRTIGNALTKFTYPIFHPLYVTLNQAWAAALPFRDVPRAWEEAMPMLPSERSQSSPIRMAADAVELGKEVVKAIPAAISRTRGKITPELKQMIGSRALPIVGHEYDEDSELESLDRLAARLGASPGGVRGGLASVTHNIIRGAEALGNTMWALPKIAVWRIGAKRGMPQDQLAYVVRNFGGHANRQRRGQLSSLTNGLFMYSNVASQFWRADYEAATNPRSKIGFWLRSMLIGGIPAALMVAAGAGVFGGDTKKRMDSIPDYDKNNYNIIPTPWGYFRVPRTAFDRMLWTSLAKIIDDPIHGKSAMETVQDIGKFAWSQVPSLSPALTAAEMWMSYLRGANPYDSFRGKNVLSQDEARAGGAAAFKEMFKWQVNQLGEASIVAEPLLQKLGLSYSNAKNGRETTVSATPFLSRFWKEYPSAAQQAQEQRYQIQDAKEKREAENRLARKGQ